MIKNLLHRLDKISKTLRLLDIAGGFCALTGLLLGAQTSYAQPDQELQSQDEQLLDLEPSLTELQTFVKFWTIVLVKSFVQLMS